MVQVGAHTELKAAGTSLETRTGVRRSKGAEFRGNKFNVGHVMVQNAHLNVFRKINPSRWEFQSRFSSG